MFYLVVIAIYLLSVALVVFLCHRRGMGKAGKVMVTVLLLLAPFWDMILSKGIMWNYALKNIPLQTISRTVKNPQSVLWIDNVWPAFDEHGRAWMVENYLDGVRLKVLGLNDGHGKIYVYHAMPEDFAASEKMRPDVEASKQKYNVAFEKAGKRINKEVAAYQSVYFDMDGAFRAQRKREAAPILKHPEIYSNTGQALPETLPTFHYTVNFQPSRLPSWQKKFVWCDEIRIHDNGDNENIAFSKRCLGYSSKVLPNPIGDGWPFYGGTRLGDEQVYGFDDKVLFEYIDVRGGLDTTRNRLGKNKL